MLLPSDLLDISNLMTKNRLLYDQQSTSLIMNYQQFIEQLLLAELANELDILEKLFALNNINNFTEFFIKRCKERATDDKNFCLNISKLPDSITNKLYWDILTVVIKPKTMADALSILAPTTQMIIGYDLAPLVLDASIEKNEKRALMNNPPLLLTQQSLSTLPADYTLLCRLILVNEWVFDSQTLDSLSLPLHQQVYQKLHNSYSHLAKALYDTSDLLKLLALDINFITERGRAPYQALKSLISVFINGGEQMTGMPFASCSAERAVSSFIEYFRCLPEQVQKDLGALQIYHHQSKSLASIYHDLEHGRCIETAAKEIGELLRTHAKNSLLLDTIETPKALQVCYKRYPSNNSFLGRNDARASLTYPIDLVSKVISLIHLTTSEDFLSLLSKFPPAIYDDFFKYIKLRSLKNLLTLIITSINTNFFTPVQLQSLSHALIKHYSRFNASESLLTAMLMINDDCFFELALASYPNEIEKLEAILEKNEYGNTIIQRTLKRPNLLTIILTSLSDINKKEAVLTKDNGGLMMIQWAGYEANPKALDIILKSFSNDANRLTVILATDYQGNNLLHCTASRNSFLQVILNALSEKNTDKLKVILTENDNKNNTLHCAATSVSSLSSSLELFSDNKSRCNAILACDKNDNTILHLAANSPKSLRYLLDLFSNDNSRLIAITKKNKKGHTPLHLALHNSDSLNAILMSFSSQGLVTLLLLFFHSDLVKTIRNDHQLLRDVSGTVGAKAFACYVEALDCLAKPVNILSKITFSLSFFTDYKKLPINVDKLLTKLETQTIDDGMLTIIEFVNTAHPNSYYPKLKENVLTAWKIQSNQVLITLEQLSDQLKNLAKNSSMVMI